MASNARPWSPSRLAGAALALTAALSAPAMAQNDKPEAGDETSLVVPSMPAPKTVSSGKKSSRPEYPKFSSVMDGFTAYPGFMTVYKKGKDKLYAVVKSSQLNRDFMLGTSFSAGSTFAGWQWNDYLLYWKKMGKRLVLMQRNVFFTGGKGEVAGQVKRTYTDRVMTTVPIMTQGGGGYVINLGSLLTGRASLFFGSLGSGNSSLAEFGSKEFKYNNEITVTMPSRRGNFFSIHYSFADYRQLSSKGYKPRIADDRVGYFLTAKKDFGKTKEPTNFVRYINRWNLQKRDASLDLSPPKEPIVFYIEQNVPVKYRRYVREGIEMWNKAFEKIGFVNAIEVRQQDKGNEFSNIDPEDMRYNFFRWITSERAFAMGPSRANPKTGEIYDADIIMDDSMVHAYLRQYENILRDFNEARLTPRHRAYLQAHPRRHPDRTMARVSATSIDHTGTMTHDGCAACKAREAAAKSNNPNVARSAVEDVELPHKYRHCSIGVGKTRELAMASLWFMANMDEDKEDKDKKKKAAEQAKAAAAQAKASAEKAKAAAEQAKAAAEKAKKTKKKKSSDFPEEFIGQVIREIVCHEVGHTLGLRHNFKASTYRTLAEINGEKKPGDISGSVMDYNPINLAVTGEQGVWAPTELGPYDFWAIEYGYKKASDKDLAKIAARGAEKGLHYGTDEDVRMGDPTINRWDSGTDPIAYATERVKFVEKMRKKIEEKAVKDGEGYQKLRMAFGMLLGELRNSGDFAVQYVGGHYANRDHKGDPNGRDPVVPVEAAKQREGLKWVCDHIFSDRHFDIDPQLLRRMAASRWMHQGAYPAGDLSIPYHEIVLNVQSWVMFDLFWPDTLRRILDAEKMVDKGEDAFTVAELFDTLEASVWKELAATPSDASARKPAISSTRRNLQRYYVEQMIDLALTESSWMPKTVNMLARHHLKRQLATIGGYLETHGANLDAYTAAHLEEAKALIDKALKAAYEMGGNKGGGFFFF